MTELDKQKNKLLEKYFDILKSRKLFADVSIAQTVDLARELVEESFKFFTKNT